MTVVGLLFLVSGFTGLVYEVLWIRDFAFVLGGSTPTLSVVLAAYMAGLALGSHLGGRLASGLRRPLAVYGWVECGVGLSAAILYWLFHHLVKGMGPIGVASPAALGPLVLRFFLSFILLLPPTLLMGLTLPFLVRDAEIRRPGHSGIAWLYGANTLGASLGCWVAGFILLRLAGMRASTGLAVGLNLAIGLAALAWERGRPALPAAPAPRRAPASQSQAPAERGFLLWAFALSGFTCFSYEIIYSRLLSYILGNRVFAASALISCFLLGLALGSLAEGRWLSRLRREARVFSCLQLAIGLWAAATLIWFPEMRALFAGWERHARLAQAWSWALVRLGEAFLILLPGAFCFGAIFPSVTRALGRSGGAAAQLGKAAALNTAGCILGCLVTGFVLLPWLGATRALLALACFSVLLGHRILSRPAWGWPGRAASALLCTALSGWLAFAGLAHDRYPWPRPGLTRLYSREDASTLVTAWSGPLGYYLYGDDTSLSFPLGAGTRALQVQKFQAHLPLALHPGPRRALVIGLGFGVSAGSLALFPGMQRVDCVEILPPCLDAAPLFGEFNSRVWQRWNCRLMAADGRYFLKQSGQPYDIITSNVTGSDLPGAASCYTREYFELARSKLAPGGLFVMHAYGGEKSIILKTLGSVFPHVSSFRAYTHSQYLLASMEPLQWDHAAINRRLARSGAVYRRDAVMAGLRRYEDLRSRLEGGDEELARVMKDPRLPLNTDDLPVLEYRFHAKDPNIFYSHF